ncbi:MAG: hypothetical protein ACW7DS_17405, partial [Paraglaciecola chathamensis]
MAHIKVPHTIIRGGFYYLNIRIQGSTFRCSLKTREPRIACAIISRIMEFINDKGGVANVHKELIQAAVANIRTEIIRRLRAVVVLDSDEPKIVV